MPYINWESLYSPSAVGNLFLDFCAENSLYQKIHEPTTPNGSILDLFFCNLLSERNLTCINVLDPLTDTSDHCTIEFHINCNNINRASIPKSFQYNKGDYASIKRELATIDWKSKLKDCSYDVQKVYDCFLQKIHRLSEKYIPKTNFQRKVRQPKHLVKMAKEKRALYKKLKYNPSLKRQYKVLSKNYKKAVARWYDEIENKICNQPGLTSFFQIRKQKIKLV